VRRSRGAINVQSPDGDNTVRNFTGFDAAVSTGRPGQALKLLTGVADSGKPSLPGSEIARATGPS
jgi:hypothetical protein